MVQFTQGRAGVGWAPHRIRPTCLHLGETWTQTGVQGEGQVKTKAEALAREHPRLSARETPTERHGTRPSRSPRKELPPPALDFGLLASGTARQYIKAPSPWYFIAAAPANQHPSLIPSNGRDPGRRRAESDCCPNAWLPLATGLHCPPCSFPQPRIGQQPPNWSPRFHHAIPLPPGPQQPKSPL